MNDDPLRNDEAIRKMLELRDQDPDAFADLFFEMLHQYPEIAIADYAPTEDKLSAIDRILKHYESKEVYEKCAFLFEIKKKIKDAKKD